MLLWDFVSAVANRPPRRNVVTRLDSFSKLARNSSLKHAVDRAIEFNHPLLTGPSSLTGVGRKSFSTRCDRLFSAKKMASRGPDILKWEVRRFISPLIADNRGQVFEYIRTFGLSVFSRHVDDWRQAVVDWVTVGVGKKISRGNHPFSPHYYIPLSHRRTILLQRCAG